MPQENFFQAVNKFSNEITSSKILNFSFLILHLCSPPPTQFDRWLTGFAGEEFSLIHKLYEFYKLLHHDTAKFPKTEKHTLGEAIKSRLLFLIDGVWKANTLPLSERLILLDQLQRTLDLIKLFIRLIYDLGIYQLKGYLYREEKLQEIGRMLGAWRKNTRKKLGLEL